MAVDHDNLICTMWQLFVIEYSRVSLRGQGKLYTTLYYYKLERKHFYYNRVSMVFNSPMYDEFSGGAISTARTNSIREMYKRRRRKEIGVKFVVLEKSKL